MTDDLGDYGGRHGDDIRHGHDATGQRPRGLGPRQVLRPAAGPGRPEGQPGPGGGPGGLAALGGRACGGAGGRDRPPARAGGGEPGAHRRPRRLDRRQRRLAAGHARAGHPHDAGQAPAAHAGVRAGPDPRQQGHRRRGGRADGLPGQQGPRPVRPRAGRPAPAAARRAQHPARRDRAVRRRRTTSGCGWRCTRRPTGCSSPRSRGCATHLVDSARELSLGMAPDPEQLGAQAAAAGPQPAGGPAQQRRGPGRGVRDAGAAGRRSAGSPR